MLQVNKFTAQLIFPNGNVIYGYGFGKKSRKIGEVCFNTGFTGYQEVLSDPSYSQQIITFSFPHIGNVGCNPQDMESNRPLARGLITRDHPTLPSNHRSKATLHDWLETHDIVGISGIDTRALVQYIRNNGAQTIAINYNNSGYINDAELQQIITELKNWGSLAGKDLATQATITKQQSYDNPHNVDNDLEVAIIDFGCKQNIIESIIKRVKKLHILPANFDIQELRQLKPDGVLLSNGPADPKATYNKYQDNIDQLVNDTDSQLPIYGICLGYQILALALGCESYKMPLGHRGANHPIYNNILQKVEITSQNHGFAIKVDSLPKGIEATHYSLFDQTLEGFKHHQKQIFAVQHHPEASPGPHDSSYFFQDFLTACQNYAKKK